MTGSFSSDLKCSSYKPDFQFIVILESEFFCNIYFVLKNVKFLFKNGFKNLDESISNILFLLSGFLRITGFNVYF